MVEVYLGEAEIPLTEEVLGRLRRGWSEVHGRLRGLGVGLIAQMECLEFSILNDVQMGRVHGQFLDDETPTDVITFDYGEILVGYETACRQATQFGSSPMRELALYGIHGMLHLAGFDDGSAKEATLMARRQEELLAEVFFDLR